MSCPIFIFLLQSHHALDSLLSLWSLSRTSGPWLNSSVYIVDQSTQLDLISTCMTHCQCHKLQWRAVQTCFKKFAHVVKKSLCGLASFLHIFSTFNFSFLLCNCFYQSPRLASFSSLKPLCLILFCPWCMSLE